MRVLVADPDPDIRWLVATRLTLRHYEVIQAPTAEEALRSLAREKVDLVLLSSDLGHVGGRHVAEMIRLNPHWTAVPLVLMTERDRISEIVLSHDRGFDDFLIKPFDPLVLQMRVALNIERARHRTEANALTHLPGNASLERVVRERIERGVKFSVLYLDINHFKSFNDRYGFDKGDDVIRQTARMLIGTSRKVAPDDDCFVAHVGGDDFVVLLDPAHEEAFASAFLAEFDRIIPTYYHAEDQRRGTIRVTNRRGRRENIPLMSCAVAACTNLHRPYRSLAEISEDAAEIKTFLKSQPGSHYLRDRRSAPVKDLKEAMEVLAPAAGAWKSQEKTDPLGQVLLGAGLITEEQLNRALKKHLETGKPLGQVLIAMNAVPSEDVGRMLEKKLNVPYVSLRRSAPSPAALRLLTRDFVQSHRVVPLEIVGDDDRLAIRLGMCDPFDLKTLDAVERLTSLKPVPCLALEDEFEDFLERYPTP